MLVLPSTLYVRGGICERFVRPARATGALFMLRCEQGEITHGESIIHFSCGKGRLVKQVEDLLTPAVLDIISHEVRTPLAAIKGFTSTLLRFHEQIAVTERMEFLREIDAAGDHLQQIIERLLLFAELAGESPSVLTTPVEIGRLVKDAIGKAEQQVHSVQSPPLSFTLVPPRVSAHDAPLLVPGNERLLHVLLDELLENARKFSPAGGTVIVQIQSEIPVKDQVRDSFAVLSWFGLSVRDMGMGIPADQLEAIFAPFAVGDASLTRVTEGMGIGLALCRRIATLFGGYVWAESNDQQGSAFHLLLPLCS
jgi:signal transduction histidine kinase